MRDGDLPFHLLPRPAQLAMDILELPEESIDQAFSVLFDKDMELYDQTYSIFKQLRKEIADELGKADLINGILALGLVYR